MSETAIRLRCLIRTKGKILAVNVEMLRWIRAIFTSNGEIFEAAPPDEFFQNPKQKRTRAGH
jgi:ABC-type histidine transport system ATPase subunit